jgi:cellulose synthase/poly-beta-1,6-N-acetylglucosamine synthase-like glycosyltransferase
MMRDVNKVHKDLSVSIIIPCIRIDDYTRQCIDHCKQLDYGNYEIILLPDVESDKVDGVKVIPTGPVSPGAKRNIGVANSFGEICAFIDSDAYPKNDWLKNAVRYFGVSEVAAVGGPGLTPDEDSLMQKAGGFVLSSFMVGHLSKRYRSKQSSDSDDIHSCNFIARKSVLKEISGWNEEYWPGEDTLICRGIKKIGKRMVEAPDVVVYHHRRPLFLKHLEQVSSYGLHRGFFAKRFKENSLRPLYFAPSLLVVALLSGSLLSLVNGLVFIAFLLFLTVFLFLCMVASIVEVRSLMLVPVVGLGIVLTHLAYGVSFIIGFVKSDLQR